MKQKFFFSLVFFSGLFVLIVSIASPVHAMNNNTTNPVASTTTVNPTSTTNGTTDKNPVVDSKPATTDPSANSTNNTGNTQINEMAKAPFLNLGIWNNVCDGAKYLYSGCGNTAKKVGTHCKNGAQFVLEHLNLNRKETSFRKPKDMVEVGKKKIEAKELEAESKKLRQALHKQHEDVTKAKNTLADKLHQIKQARSAVLTPSQEKNYAIPTEIEWKNIFARIEELEEECKTAQTLIKGDIDDKARKLKKEGALLAEKTYTSEKEYNKIKEEIEKLLGKKTSLEKEEETTKDALTRITTIIKELSPNSDVKKADESDLEQLINALSNLKKYFFIPESTIKNIVLCKNTPVTNLPSKTQSVVEEKPKRSSLKTLADTLFFQLRQDSKFSIKEARIAEKLFFIEKLYNPATALSESSDEVEAVSLKKQLTALKAAEAIALQEYQEHEKILAPLVIDEPANRKTRLKFFAGNIIAGLIGIIAGYKLEKSLQQVLPQNNLVGFLLSNGILSLATSITPYALNNFVARNNDSRWAMLAYLYHSGTLGFSLGQYWAPLTENVDPLYKTACLAACGYYGLTFAQRTAAGCHPKIIRSSVLNMQL